LPCGHLQVSLLVHQASVGLGSWHLLSVLAKACFLSGSFCPAMVSVVVDHGLI
jgi:hypothetical protein